MFKKRKWISILGASALVLVLAGVTLVASGSVAVAAPITAEDVQTITASDTGPGLLGDGYLTHGGWGRRGFGPEIDYHALLAEALGITVEELEAAHEVAQAAALAQAVEEGLITQEQADQITVWGGMGGKRGFRGFRGRPGPLADPKGKIDGQALLAEALGISVEELQAARETANQAAIAQAIEEGIITQEQADQMQARKDLHNYIDPQALLTEALGISVEDLQAARDEGKTLTDLLAENDLDAATVRDNLKAAHEKALAQAVEDGVITQEQADEMQTGRGFFPGGMGRRDFDRGGMRGKGFVPEGFEPGEMPHRDGFRGRFPGMPGRGTDTDDEGGGVRFGRPGRMAQPGSSL